VCEKVSEILAATDRVSNDPAKVLEIRDSQATQDCIKEAAALKGLSAEDFCKQIDGRLRMQELLGKNFLGTEVWRSQGIEVGYTPPIPDSITKELLESECPLHPGEKIKDTHLLVLVPMTVNGEPYTPLKLNDLCDAWSGRCLWLIDDTTSYMTRWKKLPFAALEQQRSEWVLLPVSDPRPDVVANERHFRKKRVAAQQKVHDDHYPEYREAKTLEVMTAAILRYLAHGEPRMLSRSDYLRCAERGESGGRVCVGCFSTAGLLILANVTDVDDVITGRALARSL
jgi:hypothetical protein